MAVGDIVTRNFSIAGGGANTTYQPAAGVEVCIASLHCRSNASTDKSRISWYDGSVGDPTLLELDATMPTALVAAVKIFIDNTYYLLFWRNGTTDILYYAYSGVQVG